MTELTQLMDATGPASRTASPSPSRSRRIFGPLIVAQTWLTTAHLLLDLAFGVLWFTVVVTLFSTSLGLLITLAGLPLLAVTIAAGRGVGYVERARLRWFFGEELPAFPIPEISGSFWEKARTVFTDRPGWKGIVFSFVCLPWYVVTFTVTVVAWSVGLACLAFPTFFWALTSAPGGGIRVTDTYALAGWGEVGSVAGIGLFGLVLTLVTPHLLGALADVDRWLVRTLLAPGPTEALERRVAELTVSRDASIDSASAELRRIERDLHDGAQQRLVALALDLGLARDRLDRGESAERVQPLVARAHDEAKLAIAELRDLVRGIHPTVLTDRGLDAALSALVARSPVPVDLVVRLEERPPGPIEAAAYFVVAECLANIAKHSRAARSSVTVARHCDRLTIDVFDDGVGGAVVHPGGGLGGLQDRVAAAEGTLRLSSPVGGPTLIAVELPCAS